MLFKNAKIFRLHPDFKYTMEQIPEALERHQFSSVALQEPVSNGWFFVDGQPLINFGQQVLLQIRTEKKPLNALAFHTALFTISGKRLASVFRAHEFGVSGLQLLRNFHGRVTM